MTTQAPVDVLAAVETWPEHLREKFEERAGILEYHAGETREDAERMAFEMYRGEVKT